MDIVKYLRQSASVSDDDDFIVMVGAGRCTEAADEIERLREALRMLANYGSPAPRQWWAEDIRRIALAALGEGK